MPPSAAKPYRVTHAAISDVGMRRSNNQDAVAVVVDETGADPGRGHFFMVADGMGAHAAGELASKLAVDNVAHTYRKLSELAPPAALRRSVQQANDLIHEKGNSNPEFRGMGTTCTCLVLLPGAAMVAHVGDSRVYRRRGALLEQLTFDHSLVWEMAAASHTTADKVPACIPKNVITRSLGPHESVNVDLEGPVPVEPGDTFLLCSDGLCGVVDDEVIGAVIGALPPDEATETLVDLANLRGGPDNISVIAARVEEPDPAATAGDSSPAGRVGKVHSAAWLAMALCLAAAFWFAATQQRLGALLAAAGFGASLVIALMQHKTPASPAEGATLGGPYGNGPYRRQDCRTGKAAAETLLSVVDELAELEDRLAEAGVEAKIDWGPFHDQREAARKAPDGLTSIRTASQAICGLMRQVRTGRDSQTTGSSAAHRADGRC